MNKHGKPVHLSISRKYLKTWKRDNFLSKKFKLNFLYFFTFSKNAIESDSDSSEDESPTNDANTGDPFQSTNEKQDDKMEVDHGEWSLTSVPSRQNQFESQHNNITNVIFLTFNSNLLAGYVCGSW